MFLSMLALIATPAPAVTFMYFMKGPGERPADAQVLQAMQKGHLDNLGRLAKLKKIVAAGPLQDPGQSRRGIVVWVTPKGEDLRAHLKPDPYIQQRLLESEFIAWDLSPDAFGEAIEPMQMQAMHLVIWKQGMGRSPINTTMMQARADLLRGWNKGQTLAVHGPARGGKIREIAISPMDNLERLKAMLNEDVFVQRALLEVEVLPLWMAKGVLKSR